MDIASDDNWKINEYYGGFIVLNQKSFSVFASQLPDNFEF